MIVEARCRRCGCVRRFVDGATLGVCPSLVEGASHSAYCEPETDAERMSRANAKLAGARRGKRRK